MGSDLAKWSFSSASAALGALLGAGGVFAAVVFFASDTKNLAKRGVDESAANAAQIVKLNEAVVSGINGLTSKIEAQNQQAVALAARVGAAEKSADAASSLISTEIRPQIQALRESMVRSQSDVAHLVEGIRDVKEILGTVSKQLQELRERPK